VAVGGFGEAQFVRRPMRADNRSSSFDRGVLEGDEFTGAESKLSEPKPPTATHRSSHSSNQQDNRRAISTSYYHPD
jgi:hypothetical protein